MWFLQIHLNYIYMYITYILNNVELFCCSLYKLSFFRFLYRIIHMCYVTKYSIDGNRGISITSRLYSSLVQPNLTASSIQHQQPACRVIWTRWRFGDAERRIWCNRSVFTENIKTIKRSKTRTLRRHFRPRYRFQFSIQTTAILFFQSQWPWCRALHADKGHPCTGEL